KACAEFTDAAEERAKNAKTPSPINRTSIEIAPPVPLSLNTLPGHRRAPFTTLSITPQLNHEAQKGTYFIILRDAASSTARIRPASIASRMYLDTAALFCSSTPKRTRSEALVRNSRCT